MNQHLHPQRSRHKHRVSIFVSTLLAIALLLLIVLYRRGDTSNWPRVQGHIIESRTKPAPYQIGAAKQPSPSGLLYAGEYLVSYRVNGIEYQVSSGPLCKDLNQRWLLFRIEQMRKNVEVVVRYNPANPAEGYPVLFGVDCR